MNKREFTVMVKPVGALCNMRCRYCYYLEKENISGAKIMSDKTLERLVKQVFSANGSSSVSFVWHGGEPTLAGISFFRKAVEYQKKYAPKGVTFTNNIQTNGFDFPDELLDFASDNHFDLGISVDGCQSVHDANRSTPAGKATYERIAEFIKKANAKNINADLLCTVTKQTIADPENVFFSLCSFDTGWIQFIPIVSPPGKNIPQAITGREYGSFLISIFKLWCTNMLSKCDVQFFNETASIVSGIEPAVCYLKDTCGNVPVIEADGSVYMCDHFVDEKHKIGNINSSRLIDLLNDKSLEAFGDSKQKITRQCKECRHLKYCKGGCLKDRFGVSVYNEPNHNILCEGFKMFFEYAVPGFERLNRMSKNGLSPEAMMKRMADFL